VDKVYITLRQKRNAYKILDGKPELVVQTILVLRSVLQGYGNRDGAEFVHYGTRTNGGRL
jgi:hypothetical protein